MPKILFLIRHFDRGGAQRQLISVARALRERGETIIVGVFYPGGPLHEEIVCSGISTVSLEKASRWHVFGFVRRLIQLIRQFRPEVIHSYLGSANILAVLMKPWFPGIRVVWGVRTSNMEWQRYGILHRLLYWIECKLSRFADLIIANSHSGYEYAVSKGFPKEKMAVIRNGIDIERFCCNPTAGDEFRAHHGIRSDEFLIGLVGRLDPMKGHENFLRAACLLGKENKKVCFICVGDGPKEYKAMLLGLAESLGIQHRVTWLDQVEPIEPFYNALDVLTSSSIYGEGFPNVIGEAMACEITCVATDVGDSKFILGKTGRVVPPNDVQALLAAWRELIQAETSVKVAMGKAAREQVMQHFRSEQLIEKFLDVLKPLGQQI